jgi:hypothetical protein
MGHTTRALQLLSAHLRDILPSLVPHAERWQVGIPRTVD